MNCLIMTLKRAYLRAVLLPAGMVATAQDPKRGQKRRGDT